MKKILFLLLILLVGCKVTEETYNVDLTIKPYPVNPNTETDISFKIGDKAGNPIPLEIDHERIVHVFSVREDLEEFKHMHPEDFGKVNDENVKNAQFSIKNTFAEAAKYAIVFEFTTNGKTLYKQLELDVEKANKKKLEISRNYGRIKTFGEYSVELIPLEYSEGPLVEKQSPIKAGEKTNLVFRVIKDGAFLSSGLEMYLGSEAHVAVWKEDLSQFIHTHAYVPKTEHGVGHKQMYFGPNLPVQLVFPETGLYKIFLQFKHKGKIITGDFMLEVSE